MRHVHAAESPIDGTGEFAASPFAPGEVGLRTDDSRVDGGGDVGCDRTCGGRGDPSRLIACRFRKHLESQLRLGTLAGTLTTPRP